MEELALEGSILGQVVAEELILEDVVLEEPEPVLEIGADSHC